MSSRNSDPRILAEPDLFNTQLPVVEAFEGLNVPHFVGGSVASSFHGEPRLTMDIDVVAGITSDKVKALVRHLGDLSSYNPVTIERAVEERASFNLISNETLLKVDSTHPPRQQRTS